jgi:hypothetical protein
LLAAPEALVSEPTATDYYQAADYFTGEWKGTVKVGDNTYENTLSIRWLPTRRCLISLENTDGKPFSEGVWGFDPKSRRWRGVVFAADGSTETTWIGARALKCRYGDTFLATTRGLTAGAKAAFARTAWTLVDENTFEVKSLERRAGDDRLPDIEGRWSRQK